MHVQHSRQLVNMRVKSSKILLTYTPRRDRNTMLSFSKQKHAKSSPNRSNFALTSHGILFRKHVDMTSLQESDILTLLKVLKRSKSVPEGPPWSPKAPPGPPKGRGSNHQNPLKDRPRCPQGLQRRPKVSQGPSKVFQRHPKGLPKAFQSPCEGIPMDSLRPSQDFLKASPD